MTLDRYTRTAIAEDAWRQEMHWRQMRGYIYLVAGKSAQSHVLRALANRPQAEVTLRAMGYGTGYVLYPACRCRLASRKRYQSPVGTAVRRRGCGCCQVR